MTAEDIIAELDLRAHPEGGYFRETWRGPTVGPGGERAVGTAIYYLLAEDQLSRWHRVDATEIWHFYAGAPLELSTTETGTSVEAHVLGPKLEEGHRPQQIIGPGIWQSARSLGSWTLVGCTVSPGFEFSGFEMAPPDFPGA